jgi:ATP-dependent Zn protease
VTFSDVAGVDEAKEELQEVVEFLRIRTSSSVSAARFRKGAAGRPARHR